MVLFVVECCMVLVLWFVVCGSLACWCCCLLFAVCCVCLLFVVCCSSLLIVCCNCFACCCLLCVDNRVLCVDGLLCVVARCRLFAVVVV